MLYKCICIDKIGKNIDCKNCSFMFNLYFFWGGGYLNFVFVKNICFIYYEMFLNERKFLFFLICFLV